jgi:hypothetical protein
MHEITIKLESKNPVGHFKSKVPLDDDIQDKMKFVATF